MSSSSSASQVGAGGAATASGVRRRSRRRRRRGAPPPFDQQQAQQLAAAAASSSTTRSSVEVWPEPFVEALALQVAMNASSSFGRLAVAPAIAFLFQVCSTWRAVSRSEFLWQNLTRREWNRTTLLQDTWRDEFIYWHSTASNFRHRRYAHATVHFDDGAVAEGGAASLTCLRLALSDDYLAAGFSDGSVRLFQLQDLVHLHTFRPLRRDLLGQFSRAITGIVLSGDAPRLVFASRDGDIHVSLINGGLQPTRRAQLGDVVNDGALVDFTGCDRFWVGLYAGVPGRAIHIWDVAAEQLLFVGGSLTDTEAVDGWHMLTDSTNGFIGRVRVAGHDLAVACTALRSLVFDLRHQGVVVGAEEPRRGIAVSSVDATPHAAVSNGEGAYVFVSRRGVARVRRARTMEELCRFALRGGARVTGLLGAMNQGYVLMCAGGAVRVWDTERGEYLYSLRERVGDATYMTSSERHVAVSENDTTIHLWDFGP